MDHALRRQTLLYIENHIQSFHARRLEQLETLRLKTVLQRKNPYLFKAKALNTAADLVRNILDAHLSSQEEGIFGTFLEGLAIFICGQKYGGQKSSSEGIDLEFTKQGTKYLVAVKSGPNWGNSQQIKKMEQNFKTAKRILRTNTSGVKVVAINGCCYGKDDHPDKGDYLKYCGQCFWEFISGSPDLYTDIIEPLGHQAKERNQRFLEEYAKVVNRFTLEFTKEFCAADGAIVWNRLVRFNSGKRATK